MGQISCINSSRDFQKVGSPFHIIRLYLGKRVLFISNRSISGQFSVNFRSMQSFQKKSIMETEANASGKSGHASVPLNNRYQGGLLNERIEKRNKDYRH